MVGNGLCHPRSMPVGNQLSMFQFRGQTTGEAFPTLDALRKYIEYNSDIEEEEAPGIVTNRFIHYSCIYIYIR